MAIILRNLMILFTNFTMVLIMSQIRLIVYSPKVIETIKSKQVMLFE